MKKLSIFLLGALAFAATSCEDGPSVPPIQSNPQGPVYEVEGVTVEQPSETSIVLKDYADADKAIPVGNFLVSDFPEGCAMKVVTYISKDQSFSNPVEVASTYTENTAWVNADDFQNAYVTSISKSPAAKDLYIGFAVYAVKDGYEYRLGSEKTYLGGYTMNITPFPSDLVLEDNYYLLGTINGWSVADAVKFTHSDLSAYDDPVFTIVFDITSDEADAGWWWKIVPQSTKDAGDWVSAPYAQFGPAENGDESMSGVLMGSVMNETTGKLDEPGAGVLYEAGTWMMTIDMIEGTYNIQLAVPQLYVQGDAAGWDWASPLVATLATSDYINYYGASKCAPGGYKFTSDKDWGATFNLGLGAATTVPAGWNIAGTLEQNSPNNILPEETGLYWHHVNLPGMTFESMYISTLGLIGDCTPGGWDASTVLTPSADFLVWEGDVEFGASGSFKIRANDAWDFSLGGDMSNLGWDNAPNIDTPGAGTKHVVLDLSNHPYTLTIQ